MRINGAYSLQKENADYKKPSPRIIQGLYLILSTIMAVIRSFKFKVKSDIPMVKLKIPGKGFLKSETIIFKF